MTKVRFTARTYLFVEGELELTPEQVEAAGGDPYDAALAVLDNMACKPRSFVVDSVGGPTAAQINYELRADTEPNSWVFDVEVSDDC